MSSSPTKLLKFLEEIADLDDGELAKLVPMVSPRVARGAIAAAARAIPLNAPLLDDYIAQGVALMLAMRSDHVIAAEIDAAAHHQAPELPPAGATS